MVEETVNGGAPAAKRSGGRGLFFWIKVAVLLLVVIAGGGGGWYFFLGGRAHFAAASKAVAETPLPYFFEIKPFVVTMGSKAGPSHYVQLGLNLKMSGAAASTALSAVLPEVQDEIRQTVLAEQVEEIETPAGVDRLRKILVTQMNAVLKRALGAERYGRLAGSGDLVQNIFFTTLVIE